MPDKIEYIAEFLIISGIIAASLGALLLLLKNSGIAFPGRLPGDIVIQKKNFTFYFPVATSIILSIILSLVFYFLRHK